MGGSGSGRSLARGANTATQWRHWECTAVAGMCSSSSSHGRHGRHVSAVLLHAAQFDVVVATVNSCVCSRSSIGSSIINITLQYIRLSTQPGVRAPTKSQCEHLLRPRCCPLQHQLRLTAAAPMAATTTAVHPAEQPSLAVRTWYCTDSLARLLIITAAFDM